MASKKPPKKGRAQQNRTLPSRRSPANVVASARETLRQAELGYDDLVSLDRARHLPGLRVAILLGRSVTWPLQVLREPEDDVDENGHGRWYRERVAGELGRDPLSRFFVVLRNRVEKEGILSVVTELQRATVIAPPVSAELMNAMAFAFLQLPAPFTVDDDGTLRDAHGAAVEIPGFGGVAVPVYGFEDAPDEFAGVPAQDLCRRYLDLLHAVVAEAEGRAWVDPTLRQP